MVTIKDVAARAGVALGTASRVLTGSSQTSAHSRSRVLAAAAELHYIPNGPARSLRRARTDVLGLVVSDIRNAFFSELAHAAEQEAKKRGYTVLLANANEDQEQMDDYLRIFASQRVDGLLLSSQGGLSPRLAAFRASGLPLVLLNRTVHGLDAPMVGTDNAGGVASVLSWLQRYGHRDVAFIGGPPTISTAAERLDAYRIGRERHGINPDNAFLDSGDFLPEGAAKAMHRILDRGVNPTAVFGANGPTTVGAMRALRERLGIDWATKVAVVSADDLGWFEFVSPPVSAVRNDTATVGRLGVAALIELIEGRSAESLRVPTTFVDRSRFAKV